MTAIKGRILKGVGGLYTVETEEGLLPCRARGVLRKKDKLAPIPGDIVAVSPAGDGTYAIDSVDARRNELIRPRISNLDTIFLVAAAASPAPDFLAIDKLTSIAVRKSIRPVIVFNKSDLGDAEKPAAVYRKAGFDVVCGAAIREPVGEALKPFLRGGVSAFAGASGVGKSSILNTLIPEACAATGGVSRIERGRHTTRHTELFPVPGLENSYIADTPGFTALDVERFEPVLAEDLADTFPEFGPYIGRCRFSGCAHTCEKGCAVLEAVRNGEIPEERHRSYLAMMEEVKDLRQWQLKEY